MTRVARMLPLVVAALFIAGCGTSSNGDDARNNTMTAWAARTFLSDETTYQGDCVSAKNGGQQGITADGNPIYACEVWHGWGNVDGRYCVVFDSNNEIVGEPTPFPQGCD
jgi:hypothetical protein